MLRMIRITITLFQEVMTAEAICKQVSIYCSINTYVSIYQICFTVFYLDKVKFFDQETRYQHLQRGIQKSILKPNRMESFYT